MSASYADCQHEARHVVSAWWLGGLRVDSVRVGSHADTEGAMYSTRFGREAGPEDLIVSLTGWLGDPDLPERAVWPEPWPPRPNAPEGIGVLTRRLGLTQDQYERCCERAQELVEEPAFQEAVALVARALSLAPMIDREGLEILRRAAGFPELEGAEHEFFGHLAGDRTRPPGATDHDAA